MKSKTIFLFLAFFTLVSLVWGQKKIEYGLSIGLGGGLDYEYYDGGSSAINSSTSLNQDVNSSMSDYPIVLAGISIAQPFSKKNGRWRTGLELYTFKYDIGTSIFTPSPSSSSGSRFISNHTTIQSTALQLPIGYCKRWKYFMVYAGSGITFLHNKDITQANEKSTFRPEHTVFVKKTLDSFRKIYPIGELSISWLFNRGSLELTHQWATKYLKQTDEVFNYDYGNRNLLYLGTKVYL